MKGHRAEEERGGMRGLWTEERLYIKNMWYRELGLKMRKAVCSDKELKRDNLYKTYGFGSLD